MGSFLSPGKNGHYWWLLGYLADSNVYITDSSLLPYTPSRLQTYVDFYPQFLNQRLSFEINGTRVAWALITDPSGFVYADINVPKGRFSFVTKDPSGNVLKTEIFFAKNYAMILSVMAQSLEDREVDIQSNYADLKFSDIRSGRLYNVLGVSFDFPPPPGWPVQKYRDAILGGCGPGFIKSFFFGSTKRGVADTIASITCQQPTIGPARQGVRWVVRSRANSFPTDPAAKGFFVANRASAHVFVAPHYRAQLASHNWWANAADVVVNGSQRTTDPEQVTRKTDSFVEAPVGEPFDVSGLTLQFSIQDIANPDNSKVFNTTFPAATTTAALAAAAIVAQNPTSPTDYFYCNDAIYGSASGKLRIGIYAASGKQYRIAVVQGSALSVLGLTTGMTVDVAPDQLANPWVVAGSLALDNGVTPIATGFTLVPATGELVWAPSTALNTTVPPAGTILTAVYTYQMRREIENAVSLVKHTNAIVRYTWEP